LVCKLKTMLRKASNGVVVAEPGLLQLDCSHKGAVGVKVWAVISGASEFVCSETNDQTFTDVQLVRLYNGSTSTLCTQ